VPVRRLLGFPTARLVFEVMEIRIRTPAIALQLQQVVPWVILVVVDTLVYTLYHVNLSFVRLWSVPV
jgi:hypothetical protein